MMDSLKGPKGWTKDFGFEIDCCVTLGVRGKPGGTRKAKIYYSTFTVTESHQVASGKPSALLSRAK
jgi:hypothetical protein